MNLSNIYSNLDLFNLNEFIKKPFFFSCMRCHNSPEIFSKDKDYIILECKNCSIKKEEKMSNIFDCSSEWIENKLIKLCESKHNSQVTANIFCKTCNSFLCKECFDIHKKAKDIYHNYIEVDKIKINLFCNYHNNKFTYYCEQCDLEFCQKCIEKHKEHKFIEFNDENYCEILHYDLFEKFLETIKNIQKDG